MLLYYITDRNGFAGTVAQQQSAVIRRIADAAHAGVDYIQLREKDLSARELERLDRGAVNAVRDNSSTTRLLINARTDVALACGADGVHLPSGEIAASEVRALWRRCSGRQPLIGVSAHSYDEVRQAKADGADFVVLAPVFEKVQTSAPGIGLAALRKACSEAADSRPGELFDSARFAVLALGGVNLANAGACLEAGASGIAGIRLFQTGDVAETVRQLREIAQQVTRWQQSLRSHQ